MRRETELDILRIVALTAVILVHICGAGTDNLPVTSQNRIIITFITSVVTWQVPVYVMISGRFFLDPERKITKNKLGKAIVRLVIAFVVWDAVYQMFYIFDGSYNGLNWKGIISQAIIGPYHFWYLYMAICLYLITPFLRKITEEKKVMEYFIVLFIAFEFLRNYGIHFPVIGEILAKVLVKTNFHFALGYSGYYVLGYYLSKYKVKEKKEILLYILGVITLIVTGCLMVLKSIHDGSNDEFFVKYLLPNIAVEASAIYVFFVNRVSRIHFSETQIRIISKLSNYSFGVYLVHALVTDVLEMSGMNVVAANPLFMCLIFVVITAIISNILVAGIRCIPCIGKKIT